MMIELIIRLLGSLALLIYGMKTITEDYPYVLQSITGLDEAYKKYFEMRDYFKLKDPLKLNEYVLSFYIIIFILTFDTLLLYLYFLKYIYISILFITFCYILYIF